MTLREQELREMSDATLRALVARVDELHREVHAELASRPNAAKSEDAEAWIRAVFPQRPLPGEDPPPPATSHGPGCPPGCCGAGVRQWR